MPLRGAGVVIPNFSERRKKKHKRDGYSRFKSGVSKLDKLIYVVIIPYTMDVKYYFLLLWL